VFLTESAQKFSEFLNFAENEKAVSQKIAEYDLGTFQKGDETHADVTDRLPRSTINAVSAILKEAGLDDSEKNTRDVIAFVRGGNGVSSGGLCSSCTLWSFFNSKKQNNGTRSTLSPEVCQYWQDTASAGPNDDYAPFTLAQDRKIVSYCGYDPMSQSCLSITFRCEDDAASKSCSTYKGKKTLFHLDVASASVVRYGKGYVTGGNWGEIGSNPATLQEFCQSNPCGYNNGGRCKESDGTIDSIRAASNFVRYQNTGTWECYNE